MLTDSDLPLFSGAPSAPRQPTPRPERSQVIANQRRRAKADRIRAGKDRPWVEPGTNAEGGAILVGFVPVVTYADQWRALVVEHPEAIRVVIRAALEHVAQVDRPSIDAVWLAVRGKVPKAVSNNNMRSPAVRWLMENVPALRGRFAIRNAAGQLPERAR